MKKGTAASEQSAGQQGSSLSGRSVLFLQGLATPFFGAFAARLAGLGAQIHRVHYCGADWAFRGEAHARISHHAFSGRLDDLPAFYENLIHDHAIDTIILFGDCRPVHEMVRGLADKHGITLYAMDEGYIRPGYITMEASGTNGYSRMPKDGATLQALAKAAPALAPYTPIATDMGRRVRMDIWGHAANIWYRLKFPFYKGHRPAPVWQEALGWIKRGINAAFHGRANRRLINAFEKPVSDYFLVPLQLNSDYQIRLHSRFSGMPEFIREVMTSFAEHAPSGSRLFFKNHPLDNGIINYRKLISTQAKRLGITGRVCFGWGGDLNWFLKHTKGVVLVNSTVGLAALRAGAPLKALGTAIYNLDGLTDQGVLDAFWQNPGPPQQRLAEEFLTVVETYTQVRGDLFSEAGIAHAAEEAAKVITGQLPRLPNA
ncbi:MAG: capsular biosynthesis protein [Alphaproteobacteria bacterium]|nr:capsular biosynthesis protein [Alphaproteobacteria bacterium]